MTNLKITLPEDSSYGKAMEWARWLWDASNTQNGFFMFYPATAFPIEEEIQEAGKRISTKYNEKLDSNSVLSVMVFRGKGWNMDVVKKLDDNDIQRLDTETISYLQFDDDTIGVQFKLAQL